MSARSSSRSFDARSVPKSRISAMIHGTIASNTPISSAKPAHSMRIMENASKCMQELTYKAYAAKIIAMPPSIVHNWPSSALKRNQETPIPTRPSSRGTIRVRSTPPANMTKQMESSIRPANASKAGFGAFFSVCSRLSLEDCVSPCVPSLHAVVSSKDGGCGCGPSCGAVKD